MESEVGIEARTKFLVAYTRLWFVRLINSYRYRRDACRGDRIQDWTSKSDLRTTRKRIKIFGENIPLTSLYTCALSAEYLLRPLALLPCVFWLRYSHTSTPRVNVAGSGGLKNFAEQNKQKVHKTKHYKRRHLHLCMVPLL